MHHTDKYPQHNLSIWPVWLNGCVFVQELSVWVEIPLQSHSLLPYMSLFSPPRKFITEMTTSTMTSVQYCILRTDTFLQVNCRCNGQSLFKDFVKLVSKLVVGGMEQLIEVSFILILFNVNINIKIKIPRSIFLFLKILVEKGK